jgi:hypothetical protein
MKESFIEQEFNFAKMKVIKAAVALCDEYEAAGYDLTLRQLYYQFIARDLFGADWIDREYNAKNNLPANTKNTEKNYKKLGVLISDARLAGLIDWDMIKDRGRETVVNTHWDEPSDAIRSVSRWYRRDLWENQPNHVEIMCEKQALENILEPVARRYDIPFTSNKGYSSSSTMYEVGSRLAQIRDNYGKEIFVIYYGDHDPSGLDMGRDVKERLELFSRGSVEVIRVALNMDQVEEYSPPENPAKTTDTRAKDYIEKYGRSSWELDALEPRILESLAEVAIENLRDDDIYERDAERQARETEAISNLASILRNADGEEFARLVESWRQ